MESDSMGAGCFGFAQEDVVKWRSGVVQKRDKLFRKHWKNRRVIPNLISLEAARDFEFVLDWCDESDEVILRERERRRLDKLIALGVDVNLPKEEQPLV